MLNSIRNAADNLIFRIVLGIIVVAFGFWGIDDVLRSRNNFDLVTFKNADSISSEEFAAAKAREIRAIQKSKGMNLSEEQIKQYGIDQMVISGLISERLMDQLVSDYDLDFGDKTLANFIKQDEYFKDKNGKFDVEIFKAALRNSDLSEEKYGADTKKKLLRNAVFSIFMQASYVPGLAVYNIADSMSEERTSDIVSIDLTRLKNGTMREPTDEELREYYDANQEAFVTPERRTISYILVSDADFIKNAKVSEEEARKFFNENKDEFDGAVFKKVKEQVVSNLRSKKANEAIADLAKSLDDEVAAGTSLKEIAQNFNLKVTRLQNVSAEEFMANKAVGTLIDNAFEMHKSEVSYPLEVADRKAMALLEVEDVQEKNVQALDKIKILVAKAWKEEKIASANKASLEEFASKTSEDNFRLDAQKLGLTLALDVKLKKSDISESGKLPLGVLMTIFNGSVGRVSSVYIADDKAFVALVHSANHNQSTRDALLKDSGENIAEQIRNGLMQEIMGYMQKKEGVQVLDKAK